MFNIGVGELLIVLLVAFVIVGPDDLPRVARWLGRQVRKLRLMMQNIKAETGWDELEREVNDVRKDVNATVRQLDVSANLKSAVKDVQDEIKGASKGIQEDIGQIDRDLKQQLKATDGEVRAAVASQAEAPRETSDKEAIS